MSRTLFGVADSLQVAVENANTQLQQLNTKLDAMNAKLDTLATVLQAEGLRIDLGHLTSAVINIQGAIGQ